MVDQAYLASFFTDPDKLIIAIPVCVILAVMIILVISYLPSFFRKKRDASKSGEKAAQPDRVNFRKEFSNIAGIRSPEAAVTSLSLLSNKFFARLFDIRRSFAYDEITREAEAYGFREVVELSNTLQALNFAKNTYTAADFKMLSQSFEKALD